MTQLVVQHAYFKLRFKLRYIIIPIILILLIIGLPAFINFVPNYVPAASYESTGDNGYSSVFAQLQIPTTPYRDYFENFPNQPYANDANTLLIIASPYYDFSATDIQILQSRAQRGLPTMFIGPYLFDSYNLWNYLNQFVFFNYMPIYDFDDNAGSPTIIHVYNPETRAQYVNIKPFMLESFGRSLLNTSKSSILEADYVTDSPCSSLINGTYFVDTNGPVCHKSYSVAQMAQQTIIVSDPWMMKNSVVSEYPQNAYVLADLINQTNLQINRIIFDESHYRWMDVNPTSFHFAIRRINENIIFIFFFALIAFFIPLIAAGRYGIIDLIGKKQQTKGFARKLARRLNTIHTQKLLIVPLTTEEQILTRKKFETKAHPAHLFVLAADEYLQYFQFISTALQQQQVIPSKVLQELQFLKHERVSTEVAWQILENAHFVVMRLQEFINQSTQLDTPYGDIL